MIDEFKDINKLQLKARFSYNISVYINPSGNDIILVKDDSFPTWYFVKGDKEQCKDFLKDVAKQCGVEIEIK